MAIKNIIAQGIGFSPGSTDYIPTLGFTPGTAAAAGDHVSNWLSPSMSMWGIFLFMIGWIKWH